VKWVMDKLLKTREAYINKRYANMTTKSKILLDVQALEVKAFLEVFWTMQFYKERLQAYELIKKG